MTIEEAILLDTLHCRLNFLKEKQQLTTPQVAEKVNLPIERYKKYEEGSHIPSVIELVFIADFYDTTVDYLIGRTEAS
ncbi:MULTISPECIES: helix-turn-helix domain-containing protein [Enterococcus]|uniref:HTH cro/C1-type domain-containing protein n=1 Tax=Candidatus Enterococcus mangumiae TaxID=2230878 RepID=A0ABZ2SZU7_9ENTE|nr:MULTISPECIES: helix-turn-helix transcriptional regulator [unclassified Enterococcus]MBO0462900.1 helix-turn-helix transcriptional regulator [Enterococcus sp. DIV1298c]MBO0491092.1 helix-turn-helix transcriptional regulator [Enterococcus sp. DIV1094]MBO1299251.1 helix-turn-helix transcriptional regulator [Enterococcus sp. DIV1271a]